MYWEWHRPLACVWLVSQARTPVPHFSWYLDNQALVKDVLKKSA